mmetsp:Transcript_48895/g.141639  ORF Transcript_48895/g.141639 Transcript_48895/m.141639 type:complete len:338 (-) Transcript_48895:1271-2284(-)
MQTPMSFVIVHLLHMMVQMVTMSMSTSIRTPISGATVVVRTGIPLRSAEYSSHGTGRPTVTSKMLEPMDDEMAMSPWPCRATMTEVIKSGTEVPAANTVSPMMWSGKLQVSPSTVVNQIIQYVKPAIQKIDMKKDTGKNFLRPSLRTSGMVKTSSSTIGNVPTYQTQSFHPASEPGGDSSSGWFSSSSSPALSSPSAPSASASGAGPAASSAPGCLAPVFEASLALPLPSGTMPRQQASASESFVPVTCLLGLPLAAASPARQGSVEGVGGAGVSRAGGVGVSSGEDTLRSLIPPSSAACAPGGLSGLPSSGWTSPGDRELPCDCPCIVLRASGMTR